MNNKYKEYYDLLDTMQETGQMNMYGAAQMLRELDDDLSKHEATDIAVSWMKQKVVSDD